MDYNLSDLLDIPKLQKLLDELDTIYSIPSAIIDLEGNILIRVAWQDICTKFHRVNSESEKDCIKSDTFIVSELSKGKSQVVYKCPGGLIDTATPIIVDGHHIGNAFTGQFFLEQPDEEFFRKRAKKYGFNEKSYIEALRKVPIISEEKHNKNLKVLSSLTEMLAEMGLQQKRQIEIEFNLEQKNKELNNEITERKKTESDLQSSNATLRSLIESTDDATLISDKYALPLLWNETYARIMKEALGIDMRKGLQPHKKLQDEKVVAWWDDLHRRVLSGESFRAEYSHDFGKDDIRHFEISYNPIFENGKVSGFSEFTRDITQRKKSEEALINEKEKLQKYLDISAVMVIMLDKDQRVTLINKKGCEILGCVADETIGKNWFDNFIPEKKRDHVKAVFDKLMAGEIEPANYYENVILTKNGKERLIAWYNTVFRDKDGNITNTLGTGADITERKQVEIEREQLTSELITKNKELEQVLYVTSHDLRSPLVNVEGYSNELDYSLKELMSSIENEQVPLNIKEKITPIVKKDIPESLHYIRTSVLKMNTLLKGILTLSRLGRYKLKIEEIDMNEMITEIVDNHRFRLNELSIKMEVSKLPNCMGDSSQLNQVFSNLLDNAIKYLDSERSCVINISGYNDKDQSVYCIEDNGLGIAPEHQDKIFEIFHQLEPHRFKGEGMGLTIAHRIIEKQNGKIWVESELGKGSKFFVSLPS